MMGSTPLRSRRWEWVAFLVVLLVFGSIPFWAQGWWTCLPLAATVGGVIGGRWIRWYWAPVIGFAAGAAAWGVELLLLPAAPRTRLADVLGPVEGVSGPIFTLLGPVLFGLVAAVSAAAVAGAIRLALERAPTPPTVASPETPTVPGSPP